MFRKYITNTRVVLLAALLIGMAMLPESSGEGLGGHHAAGPLPFGGVPAFTHAGQNSGAPFAIPGPNGNAFGLTRNIAGNEFGLERNITNNVFGNIPTTAPVSGGRATADGSAAGESTSGGARIAGTGANTGIGSGTNTGTSSSASTTGVAASGAPSTNGPFTPQPVFQGSLSQGIPGIHGIPGLNQPTVSGISSSPAGAKTGGGVHIVPAQGTVFQRANGSVIDLTSGQLLVSSHQRQGSVTVRTPHGQEVLISKNADVLVTADGDSLRVQNLTGMGRNVQVQGGGSQSGHAVSVDPGFEVIAKPTAVAPSDILSGDGIARRNAVVLDDGSLGVSEVHLPSLIAGNQTIRTALHKSGDPAWQKQLTDSLLRTAAAISTIRGDGGFQQTAPENQKSLAVASSESTAIHPLGQAVSAAAHAAQEAGGRVSEAVHEVIRNGQRPPPPPPPPPPPTPPGGAGGARQSVSGTATNAEQQTANAAGLQALAVIGPLQPQNIDTTRPRISDPMRQLPKQRGLGRNNRQPGEEAASAGRAHPNETGATESPAASQTAAQEQAGSLRSQKQQQPVIPRSLIAFAAPAHGMRTGNARSTPLGLAEVPPLVEESIRKHPDLALAVGILILMLLCVTAILAHIAHRRALAIGAQIRELNTLNQQLQIARDQAIEASRLKSQFVANISHEIRTPMSAVLGTIGLLFNTKLDEEQKEIAGVLKDSARSLLDVINDILDFSKIEAGMVKIQASDFSPAELIKEVAEIGKAAATEKQLQLTGKVDAAVPPYLRGDPFRLRQILLNLVNNAVKFTPAGSVHIKAQTHHVAGDQVWLLLTVKDTGIGISDEAKGRLFQPFVQADGSTTRQFGGTGLGLSISKRLAELLGGSIELESTVGEGSTFSVLVPMQATEAPAQIAATPLLPPPGTAGGIANKRILVAEDSTVLQRIIKIQLEKLGCEVQLVSNGAEAVEAATTGQYAMILMDWQMPTMDGLQATEAIRHCDAPAAATIPIIAMTANAMEGHRETCLSAGMNDYISKPFSSEQLRAVVERWCPDDNA